ARGFAIVNDDLPSWVPLATAPPRPGDQDMDALCRADRIAALRWVAGRMVASPHRVDRWVGHAFLRVLAGDDPLDAFMLRPPQGSQRTLRHIEAWRRRDEALLALVDAVGHCGRALEMLRG